MTDKVIEILIGIQETNEQIFAQMHNGDAYLNEENKNNAEQIYGDDAKEYTITD